MRLSESEYVDKFILKGGTLISSYVGIDRRITMDLDITLQNLQLNEENIINAFKAISSIECDDGISFIYNSIKPIRKDDDYGGYVIGFYAKFGKMKVPMSIDISTGDVITHGAKMHKFIDLLDDENTIELWSYNIETVLAEKIEAILNLGIANTRIRDYYDVYNLVLLKFKYNTFKKALMATADHRKTLNKISEYKKIIQTIKEDKEMNR